MGGEYRNRPRARKSPRTGPPLGHLLGLLARVPIVITLLPHANVMVSLLPPRPSRGASQSLRAEGLSRYG